MKKRILAVVLTMIMCVGVLAGCGGKEDTPTSGGSSSKTEKLSDSGKKSGNTVEDLLDFSDTFDFDIGERFNVDELRGVTIPIPTAAADSITFENESIVRYEYDAMLDDKCVGRYWMEISASNNVTENWTAEDSIGDHKELITESKGGRYEYAENFDGRYLWLWRREIDYDTANYQEDIVMDGLNYPFMYVEDIITPYGFNIRFSLQKATNIYGEDCISKDGKEYAEKIVSLIESYNDKQ